MARQPPGAKHPEINLYADAVHPGRIGAYLSVDEAQSKAFIADIELERRASAIAVYDFVTGIMYLPASLIAGALWLLHPASAFIVAVCAPFVIAAFVGDGRDRGCRQH